MALSTHAITVTLDTLNDPALPPITGATGIPPGGFGVIPSIPDDGQPAGRETSIGTLYILPPPPSFSSPEVGWHADWTIVDATGRFNSHRAFLADSVDVFQFPVSGQTFAPAHYLTVEAGDIRFNLHDALDNFRGLLSLHGARLIGNDLANFLEGGSKADEIVGGSGCDTITGRNGGDDLFGGNDSDTFIFKSRGDSDMAAAGRDHIHDFQGHDHSARDLVLGIHDTIDLHAIDADTTQAGNQDFSFIGNGPYTGDPGELMERRGVVKGDVDGDFHSDFAISVHGLTGTADDFNL